MKRYIFQLIACALAIAASISIGSCRKAAINGDLDGQWQIMEIALEDGPTTHPERTYYCLYLHTVNLTSVGDGSAAGNMAYDDKNRKLTLDFPNNTPQSLNRWGIVESRTTFDILQLSSSKMTLKSNHATLTFRKF